MTTIASIDLWGGQARAQQYHESGVTVDWTDRNLRSIDRLRYIGEYWAPLGGTLLDFSYAYGTLCDGTKVRVRVSHDVQQVLVRKGQSLRSALVEAARKDGVYLKGLGALDNLSVND